jgi:hypothetical protein
MTTSKKMLRKGNQTGPTDPNVQVKTSQTHPQDPSLKEATSNSECKFEDGKTKPM